MKFPFSSKKPEEFAEPKVNPVDHSPVETDLNSADEFETSQQEPSQKTSRNISPRRILIVDDDATIRGLLAKVLNRAGYHVKSAEDGEKGWAAICAERFDLLITDHEMPHLCGLDLLRRMRNRGNKMPAILISGAMPRDARDLPLLLEPGAALDKPFPLPLILAKAQALLSSPAGVVEDCDEFRSATFNPSGLPLWNAVVANTHF